MYPASRSSRRSLQCMCSWCSLLRGLFCEIGICLAMDYPPAILLAAKDHRDAIITSRILSCFRSDKGYVLELDNVSELSFLLRHEPFDRVPAFRKISPDPIESFRNPAPSFLDRPAESARERCIFRLRPERFEGVGFSVLQLDLR